MAFLLETPVGSPLGDDGEECADGVERRDREVGLVVGPAGGAESALILDKGVGLVLVESVLEITLGFLGEVFCFTSLVLDVPIIKGTILLSILDVGLLDVGLLDMGLLDVGLLDVGFRDAFARDGDVGISFLEESFASLEISILASALVSFLVPVVGMLSLTIVQKVSMPQTLLLVDRYLIAG
jgi:hypothetical protein